MKIEPLIVVTCTLMSLGGTCLGLSMAMPDPAATLGVATGGLVLSLFGAIGAGAILWIHESKLVD